jgi:hypothetical protein
MTFPLGCGGVGGAGLLGHVARWALTGRRHRGTVYCPYVYRRCFMAVNPPCLHFLEKKSGEGADGDLKATGIGAIALLAYI